MDLINKKILITGGAGFIGSHLVGALLEKNSKIIVFDNFSSGCIENLKEFEYSNFIIMRGDIRDEKEVEKACKDIDVIFHYAADPDVRSSVNDPYSSFMVNVLGSINILEAARKFDISGIVFASSGGTLYGEVDIDKIPTPEDVQFRPISPYGASKAAIEPYLSAYADAYGITALSLRFANVYGPKSTHGVMYDFYHKLKKNPNELLILGNGLQKKSYLYISDCIEATIMAAEYIKKGYDAFNLGTEIVNSVNEVANAVIEAMDLKNVKLKYTGGDRGWIGDVKYSFLSIDKIKSIGWAPKITLKEGVFRYIKWLEDREPL